MTATTAPTVPARVAEVAAAHADDVAVRDGHETLTYAELDRRAAAVAAALAPVVRPTGAADGAPRVGLVFGHSAGMVVAVLGALRAGAAYVPLDAAYPPERLAYLLGDSGAATVLADAANAGLARRLAEGRPVLVLEELAEGGPEAELPVVPEGDAYVLYTSGSTGRPKPVVQSHRNLCHHIDAWVRGLGIGPGDRLSLQSAYSWDSAVQDTFAALLSGASLHPLDLRREGVDGVVARLGSEGVTVYHSTLPIYRAVVRVLDGAGGSLPGVRVLALGGDHVHRTDAEAARRRFPGAALAGAYGSTECSCALLSFVDLSGGVPEGPMPLGEPVVRTRVELLGPDEETVTGPGEGEIVVHSEHLARVPGADGALVTPASHHTGDLARRDGDGTLTLLGRRDLQIKIDGMRVDVGEVEGLMRAQPDVRDAAVAAHPDGTGDRRLVGYVVPTLGAGGPGPTRRGTGLRERLARRLPPHAVPTSWVSLDALPLTANHKIDRMALPVPTDLMAPFAPAAVPTGGPGSARERVVARVWAQVLGEAVPGLDDNFFDLGGSSLRLGTVHALLHEATGVPVTMVDLYAAPTVRRLARLIDERAGTAGTPGTPGTSGTPGTPGTPGTAAPGAAADRGRRRAAARAGARRGRTGTPTPTTSSADEENR